MSESCAEATAVASDILIEEIPASEDRPQDRIRLLDRLVRDLLREIARHALAALVVDAVREVTAEAKAPGMTPHNAL